MNAIKHVFPIFDFRACVYAKIKERGVMIHSRVSFDGFENGISRGKIQGVTMSRFTNLPFEFA